MKRIAFFVVVLMAMMSYTIFGLGKNSQNIDVEYSNQTSLSTTDLKKYVKENTTNSIFKNPRKKIDNGNDFNGSIYTYYGKSYNDSYSSAEIGKRTLKYLDCYFDYCTSFGSYTVPTLGVYKVNNTNYIEFTLDSAQTITIYASSNTKKGNHFICDEVSSNDDETYTVINRMTSKDKVGKRIISKIVFVLAKGTYHIGVENSTAYIYGIYSSETISSQLDDTTNKGMVSYKNPLTNKIVYEEIDDTNVSVGAKTSIQPVLETNVLVNGVEKKLVYFIFELNNIYDKSSVNVKYSGSVTLNGKVIANYENQDREVYTYLNCNGNSIVSAQTKDNTYYAYASFRFNNSENYNGIEFDITFEANIEGVTGNFAQTSSYTFNY